MRRRYLKIIPSLRPLRFCCNGTWQEETKRPSQRRYSNLSSFILGTSLFRNCRNVLRKWRLSREIFNRRRIWQNLHHRLTVSVPVLSYDPKLVRKERFFKRRYINLKFNAWNCLLWNSFYRKRTFRRFRCEKIKICWVPHPQTGKKLENFVPYFAIAILELRHCEQYNFELFSIRLAQMCDPSLSGTDALVSTVLILSRLCSGTRYSRDSISRL